MSEERYKSRKQKNRHDSRRKLQDDRKEQLRKQRKAA